MDRVIPNRKAFENYVYTPLEEALQELTRRRNDPKIQAIVSSIFPDGIPEPFQSGPRAVLFRQLATSNYEVRRFFSIADSIQNLMPLFWEYHQDKFTSNNSWKHSLGKMLFYKGKGKKNGNKIESLKIIDFNSWNGKPIAQVQTLWSESLVDFHHAFFSDRFRLASDLFFDASAWFAQHGGVAGAYYRPFLSLFLQHGILFENFMLEDEGEYAFTKEIFLPAFTEIFEKTGLKPLIVSLEPTDIEGDDFWICHPYEDREYVEQRGGDSLY